MPINAVYAGHGGDFGQNRYVGDHVFAVCVMVLAAFPLLSGALRLFRVVRAVRGREEMGTETTRSVSVVTAKQRVRAVDPIDGRTLEWKLLRAQGEVTSPTLIYGRFDRGRWLVVETAGNRLIWPATRSQPVVGAGMPHVPQAAATSLNVIGAHHRLLAAYVEIITQLKDLPFIIRCAPGQPTRTGGGLERGAHWLEASLQGTSDDVCVL